MNTGIVFDIKEFAVFDGPGIRTTVFMKGCPLRCQWCHNPEGLTVKPQLMVSTAACQHCGACEKICPSPGHCVTCGKCIPVCRGNFRKIVGTEWNSAELAMRLQKDKDVYSMSGGGITFSGGEPLLQWPFVKEVMDSLKDIHKAIETSGFASDETFESAMKTCDLIMMDWKVSDPEKHKHFTGVEQETILRHIRMLASGNTPFIIRMPIIPGVNDNYGHFETVSNLVKNAQSLVRVDVLPYQLAAGAKYEMVNMKYSPEFDEKKHLNIYTDVFTAENIPFCLFK